MSNYCQEADRAGAKRQELPPVGDVMLVQCGRFRCLGFLDDDGRWKDAFRHEEIKDVESWEFLSGDLGLER